MTIHQPTSNPLGQLPAGPSLDIPVQNAGLDESVLNKMAAEFFSALPGQSPQGFNFDVPAHQPQPKDPVLALAGRIPGVVQQHSLNPDLSKHYVNPAADHPERRLLSSAPIVGGAHTPDPFGAIPKSGNFAAPPAIQHDQFAPSAT